ESAVLPAITDPVAAVQPSATPLHDGGNVIEDGRVVHGDPDAPAEVVVEGEYEIGMQDQAPLGPEAGLAIPDPDGGVTLHIATQWLHEDLRQIAACLGLPESKVHLVLAGVGGAFGAREDVTLQIHLCLLALATGRPVKMVYGREESFLGHVHRHPARMWYRHEADRTGRLVRVEARIVIDGGAYASTSAPVIGNACYFAVGPYRCPSVRVDGVAEARVVITPRGAEVHTAAAEVGQGISTVCAQIARSVLGMEAVEVRFVDTSRIGPAHSSSASRQTQMTGGAVLEAARRARS